MYLEALKLRYESEIMAATANLKNYIETAYITPYWVK